MVSTIRHSSEEIPHLCLCSSGLEHRVSAGFMKWSEVVFRRCGCFVSSRCRQKVICCCSAHCDVGCADLSAQGKQVYQTIVDATTSGNISRFFNHCCDPTLSVFVVSKGQD